MQALAWASADTIETMGPKVVPTAVPTAVPMAVPMGLPANMPPAVVINNNNNNTTNITNVTNVQQNGDFVSMLDKVHPFTSCCCCYAAFTPSVSSLCNCQCLFYNCLLGCGRAAEEGCICCEVKCVAWKLVRTQALSQRTDMASHGDQYASMV